MNRLERWNAKVESLLMTEAITCVWICACVTIAAALDIVGVF